MQRVQPIEKQPESLRGWKMMKHFSNANAVAVELALIKSVVNVVTPTLNWLSLEQVCHCFSISSNRRSSS